MTDGTLKIGRTFFCWGEITVSRAGDPVHAGDKALTRETPAQKGRVNRYVCNVFTNSNFFKSRTAKAVNRIVLELNIAIKGIIEGITIEVNLDEMLKMTQQET